MGGGKNREGSQRAALKVGVFRDSVHLLIWLLCGCLSMFTYILDTRCLGVGVCVCVDALLSRHSLLRVSTCPLFMSALQMSPI